MIIKNKKTVMNRLVIKSLERESKRAIKRLNKMYLDETVKEEELLEEEKYIQKLQKEIEEVKLGRKDLRKYYDLMEVHSKFENDEDYILCKIK